MGQKQKATQKSKSQVNFKIDFTKAKSIQIYLGTFKIYFQSSAQKQIIFNALTQKTFHDFMVEGSFDHLIQLKLSQSKQIKLPSIKAPFLQQLKITQKIQSLQQFSRGSYPSLTSIQIASSQLEYIFALDAPNLKDIMIRFARVLDLKQFATGIYPELKHMKISFCNCLSQAPKLNAPNLETVRYYENSSLSSIQQFSKGTYPQLKSIYFSYNNFSSIYALDAPNIREICFSQNNIKDLSQFAKTAYPFLQSLYLANNFIQELPQIQAPNLIDINLSNNLIIKANQFAKTKYLKLKILNLSQNKVPEFLLINAPNIKKAFFDRNRLNQILSMQNQALHYLQYFNAGSCALNRLPKCLCFSLNSKLLTILLEKNFIGSIEILGWLNLSRVKYLNLSQNRISSFHALKRLKIPQIHNLYLQGNLVSQKDPIQRSQIMPTGNSELLHQTQRKTLFLETLQTDGWESPQTKMMQTDISWVFKMKCCKYLKIRLSKRNNWRLNKKIVQALKKKQLGL